MKSIRITYDPEGDMLSITFGPPIAATGYQLSEGEQGMTAMLLQPSLPEAVVG